MCSFIVLEPRSLKSVSLGQNQGGGRVWRSCDFLCFKGSALPPAPTWLAQPVLPPLIPVGFTSSEGSSL